MRVLNMIDQDKHSELTPITGSVALRELYIWPGWYTPTSNVLFSYERSHQKGTVYNVLIEMGKTYTFYDIQGLLLDHLNQAGRIANVYHNAGMVTMNIQNTNVSVINLKLCDELANILKLPKMTTYSGFIQGKQVNEADIKLTFSNTDHLYFKCREIDETKVFENSKNSDLIALVPLEYSTRNDKLIKFRDLDPLFHPLTTRKTVYALHFSVEDEHGNKLPLLKHMFTVLNKA